MYMMRREHSVMTTDGLFTLFMANIESLFLFGESTRMMGLYDSSMQTQTDTSRSINNRITWKMLTRFSGSISSIADNSPDIRSVCAAHAGVLYLVCASTGRIRTTVVSFVAIRISVPLTYSRDRPTRKCKWLLGLMRGSLCKCNRMYTVHAQVQKKRTRHAKAPQHHHSW